MNDGEDESSERYRRGYQEANISKTGVTTGYDAPQR